MRSSRFFALGSFLAVLFFFIYLSISGHTVQVEKNASFLVEVLKSTSALRLQAALEERHIEVVAAAIVCNGKTLYKSGEQLSMTGSQFVSTVAQSTLMGVQTSYKFSSYDEQSCQMQVIWPWPQSLLTMVVLALLTGLFGSIYLLYQQARSRREDARRHSAVALRVSRELRGPVAKMSTVLSLMEEADGESLHREYLPVLRNSRDQLEKRLISIVRRDE